MTGLDYPGIRTAVVEEQRDWRDDERCELCGVWTCGFCGWQRLNAKSTEFVVQDCFKCGGRQGAWVGRRHRYKRAAEDHDEYAAKLRARQGKRPE